MRTRSSLGMGGGCGRFGAARTMPGHEVKHGGDCDRTERRAGNVIDLAENLAERVFFARRLAALQGIYVLGPEILEQLDDVEQRGSARIAAELISAAGATDRPNERGPAEHVHDLGEMMIGNAVFGPDLAHRQLAVGMSDQL